MSNRGTVGGPGDRPMRLMALGSRFLIAPRTRVLHRGQTPDTHRMQYERPKSKWGSAPQHRHTLNLADFLTTFILGERQHSLGLPDVGEGSNWTVEPKLRPESVGDKSSAAT